MVQLNWTAGALEDLNQIREYIIKDSEKNAEAVVMTVFERVEIPYQYPKIGKEAPEVH